VSKEKEKLPKALSKAKLRQKKRNRLFLGEAETNSFNTSKLVRIQREKNSHLNTLNPELLNSKVKLLSWLVIVRLVTFPSSKVCKDWFEIVDSITPFSK